MKTVAAIRHVPFEDLGSFARLLADRGARIEYVEAGLDDLAALDPLGPELLVVLGGPIGANDEKAYPWLSDEMRLLERRLAADRPTLGICLGAQLMARALGARVYAGGAKEIGWAPLRLTEAGERSCLAPLSSEGTAVLHWHVDTFDLPHGAVHLAATEAYENQAFSWGANGGRSALALQFHAEVTAKGLERWFIGHAFEIAKSAEPSVATLRAQTARWAAGLEVAAAKCLRRWLAETTAAMEPQPEG